MKIKSIIVDDEKHGRENLAGILRQYCPDVDLVGEADSVDAAVLLIQKTNPDLVFLDIEMPKANGFQLLEHFRDFRFEVIFVTAYDNYAIRAIRFSASDYILKPINLNELIAAVEKVSERIRNRSENERIRQLYLNTMHPANPKIGLPTGERVEFVEVKSIVRCQGESNYTHIYFADRKPILTAKSLIEFEELLAEYGFVRVHKTHLINLNQVTSYTKNDGGVLFLSNGDSVAISRRRKDFVLEQLKMRLKYS